MLATTLRTASKLLKFRSTQSGSTASFWRRFISARRGSQASEGLISLRRLVMSLLPRKKRNCSRSNSETSIGVVFSVVSMAGLERSFKNCFNSLATIPFGVHHIIRPFGESTVNGIVVRKLKRLDPFGFPERCGIIRAFLNRVDIPNIPEAVTICVKGLKQHTQRCVFGRISNQNKRIESHAVLHILRGPAVPKVSVSEITG